MPTPANLVYQQATTTGTGNFTLTAVNGKQSFATAFSTGVSTNVFDYYISNLGASEWERGTGHMSDATTLVRDTVIESTNANAAVNFSAGTKDVTNDVPALKQIYDGRANAIIGSSSTVPSGDVFVTSQNATTLPAASTGAVLHIGSGNGTGGACYFDGFAVNPTFAFRRANNTAASPSALNSGDIVMNFVGLGYGSTSYAAAAKCFVRGAASENWTDSAQGMDVYIGGTPQGSTTQAETVRFPGNGGAVIGTAALATNATKGFLYIPTCAGTPTGTPETHTGTVAMIYDTTNNKLYIYNGGWKGGTAPGTWS